MKKGFLFEQIKEQFSNPDWTTDDLTICYLDPTEKNKTTRFIVDQLKSHESWVRFIASKMIIKFHIEDAVEPLIGRILDSDTKNSNGTMAFALGHLNCKNQLVKIFEILATQSFESKCHAYNLLCEQEFLFSEYDIHEMYKILKLAEQNKEKNQIHDNETMEMVKDGYEGFAKHLIK